MLKISSLFLLLAFVLLSCGDADLNPPQQRINRLDLFDVGNSGGVNDLTVVFEIENLGGIDSYRVFVVPSSQDSLSKEEAFLLTPDRYQTIELSNRAEHVARLGNILDVNGDPIQSNQSYFAQLLMLGESFNQLSMISSNSVLIEDKGIFVGNYRGFFTTNVRNFILRNTTSGLTNFNVDGSITESAGVNSYIGNFSLVIPGQGFFQGPTTESGTVRFVFDGTTFSDFSASGNFIEYSDTYIQCDSLFSGFIDGIIERDIKLTLVGKGCDRGVFELELFRSVN